MSKTKSTSINSINKRIEEIEEKQKELKKDLSKIGRQAVGMLKDIINESPYLEAIRWDQYTPYFNDGETCEFGVHDLEIKFVETIRGASDSEDEDFMEGFQYAYEVEEFLNSKKDVLNYKDIDKLHTLCSKIEKLHSKLMGMEDMLQEAFGDHVTVTVTKKGIETEEVEHD